MSDYLPRELHLEILKRLPLISILHCRSVCKSWNSLITSSDFISSHQGSSKSVNENVNQKLLIRYFDRTRKIERYIVGDDDDTFGLQFFNLELPFTSKSAFFRIVGCCDGLLCLSDDLFDSMYNVILWNPSIRKSIQVLVPNHEQTWPQVSVLGFGVCPVTHDPKIVRVVSVSDFSVPDLVKIQDPPMVDVFSVSSGIWRKPFGCNRLDKLVQVNWSQVCFNGVIHWLGCDRRVEGGYRWLIVSFDLVDEVFGEIVLPDVLALQPVSKLSVCTRKGCLALLVYARVREIGSCGVWVMKEYGDSGSWTKLFTIQIASFLRKTVGFRMNGDIFLALKNHELVSLEGTGDLRHLDIFGNIRSFFLGSYMESLILLNQPDGKIYGGVDVDDDDDSAGRCLDEEAKEEPANETKNADESTVG